MTAPPNHFRAIDLWFFVVTGVALCVMMVLRLTLGSASRMNNIYIAATFMWWAEFGYLLIIRREPIRREFLIVLELSLLLFAGFGIYFIIKA